MSKEAKSPKLTPKFDPIWRQDFQDLKNISPTAFVVRQLIRLARDLETNISNLPDTQIEKETGIVRKAIRRARRELISAGYIVPHGYHTYFIRPFRWVVMTQPEKNHLGRNDPSLGSKVPNHLGQNDPSLGSKVPNSILIQKQNNTETEGKIVFVPVLDDEIPALKIIYPWNKRENLKTTLMTLRGHSEADVGKIFERVYPQQYTGKAV